MEHFLTARYCLYAGDGRGRLWRGEIHHPPWPLQHAEAEISLNTVTAQIGLILPQTQPLLHFARQLKVLAWALRQLEQPRRNEKALRPAVGLPSPWNNLARP